MAKVPPPRMFTAANRPARAPQAPKQEVEPPKDLLESSRIDPSGTPLYHGTTHFFGRDEVLKPKDTVNARTRRVPLRDLYGVNVPSKVRTTDYVYSTSDLETAKKYATQAAEGRNQRFAPVYEVEPTGDVFGLRKILGAQDPKGPKFSQELLNSHVNSYISDKEMVPKNIATWVENPSGKIISKEFDALTRAVSAMTGAPAPTYVSKAQHISNQFANVDIPVVQRKQD